MSDWYAPNQQAVRGDQSGPGEEGTGGEPGDQAGSEETPVDDYDSMTKAELIEAAQARGISPANNDMTKDELKQALAG